MSAEDDSPCRAAMNVLLCGGLAGVITWTSIFPLDVIKTRVQSQSLPITTSVENRPLLTQQGHTERNVVGNRLNAFQITKLAYREEGLGVFFRGLGVCSIRAFIVNAVQVCFTVHHGIRIANLSSGQCMNGQCVLCAPYKKHPT